MPKPKPLRGFGPASTPELLAVGIHSLDAIRELGWEEAYLRWVERFPKRINVNAAVGMLAAEKGLPWFALPPQDKALAKAVVARLRTRARLLH